MASEKSLQWRALVHDGEPDSGLPEVPPPACVASRPDEQWSQGLHFENHLTLDPQYWGLRSPNRVTRGMLRHADRWSDLRPSTV